MSGFALLAAGKPTAFFLFVNKSIDGKLKAVYISFARNNTEVKSLWGE
jgi:hypothetical protein